MTAHTKGRPATFAAIVTAGTASAALNVWGASQLFSGPASVVFAIGILAMEGIALLSLAHIIEDWNNNHRAKAALAGVIFAFAVFGCALSGHRAFHVLSVRSAEFNQAEGARADRLTQQAADGYERAAIAAETKAPWTAEKEIANAEAALAEAAEIRGTIASSAPPSALTVLALIALFELVKTAGRYSIATATRRQWSPEQKKAATVKKDLKRRIPRTNTEKVVPMFALA